MKQQNSAFVLRICHPSFMQRRKTGGDEPPASVEGTLATARRLVVFFLLLLLVGASVYLRWINDAETFPSSSSRSAHAFSGLLSLFKPMIGDGGGNPAATAPTKPQARLPRWPPLTCPTDNRTDALSCPTPPPSVSHRTPPTPGGEAPSPTPLCPDYFRWIHEDLRRWAVTGITREMVERARETATFRLVVIDGRAYVESYGRRTFQTRDVFTQWGIIQLLRRYPGRVPDLELMFDCDDIPAVAKAAYPGEGNATTAPPPLFGYCSDDSTLDIAFPDWSFWGWPEIKIKPWEPLLEDLREGNRRVKWVEREPYAYWKGNPTVADRRWDLLRCNVSATHDWNARLYAQDWSSEEKQGFKKSDLASQCKHRYKIYIEGRSWSVSEKYILSCDSPVLLVTPRYYDFFSRGLQPLRHYWPVRADAKCPSIKFAVDWGSSHQEKVQAIGKEGSGFIREQVKMDYVYDYMLHLLSEYAKLLTFKPTKPPGAIELCPEILACRAKGLEKEYMVQSMVTAPRDAGPCTLPPAFGPAEMRMLIAGRASSTKQVELWEQEALQSQQTKGN